MRSRWLRTPVYSALAAAGLLVGAPSGHADMLAVRLIETGPVTAAAFPSQLSVGVWPLDSQAGDDFILFGLPGRLPAPTAFLITNVQWRGGYRLSGVPVLPAELDQQPRSFRLLFYADADGAPATEAPDPTVDALASYDLGLGFVQETADGDGLRYSAALDPPLLWPAGVRGWLVVQCLLDGPLEWRWRAGEHPGGADPAARGGFPAEGSAYWSVLGDTAYPGPHNLAFALFGVEAERMLPEPPDPAAGPGPPDGAKGRPRRLVLTWEEAARAAGYEIYLGVAPEPPSYRGLVTDPVYYPAEELRSDTLYFWRVDARNAGGVTPGPLWSFRTAARNVARCDCDCDGRVNANDINAFITALAGPAGYAAAFPDCLHLNADADGSGAVDFDDIPAFIGCLVERGSGQIKSELAGRPLPGFPHFQFADVLLAAEPVYIAVDPARLPQLVGQTADVHVVASRSIELWLAEPHLFDVTPGGPLTVTFSAGGIAANTFLVANPGELVSVGQGALAVGYDVVLDLNRNGRLDAGDLIDGLGARAGFYYLGDLTLPGPRPTDAEVRTATAVGLPPGRSFAPGPSCAVTADPCNRQKVFYPADLTPAEQLPLVVISHGNTHNLRWYDYLGRHLASHGYVVLAHAVNAQPGPSTAAESTLLHVDAFLGQLAEIAGGALAARVDATRMAWIGHSRGGEGVVLARHLLARTPPGYSAVSYDAEAVRALVAIAPTDFNGPQGNNPGMTPFLLLYGSADGDVYGGPDDPVAMPFSVYERATGTRASAYLHGAGHNHFNCCGLRDWSGAPGFEVSPDLTQRFARAMVLAFLADTLHADPAAREVLARPFRELRPPGVLPRTPAGQAVTVSREFRASTAGAPRFVIDDFQSEPDPGVSSSGGSVSGTVQQLAETRLIDSDRTFTYAALDRSQGMTRAGPADDARGLTFEAPPGVESWLEFGLPPGRRDLRGFTYLSLRVCQVTRAPQTVALAGPAAFTIALRDAAGRSSALPIGAFGDGPASPYGRGGAGAGQGWANEFETLRLRLDDFLHHGAELDLSQVVAVRLSFGPAHGSAGLHLGLDDLELSGE